MMNTQEHGSNRRLDATTSTNPSQELEGQIQKTNHGEGRRRECCGLHQNTGGFTNGDERARAMAEEAYL